MEAGVTASPKEVRKKDDEPWKELVEFWKQLTAKKVVKFILGVFVLVSVIYTLHALISSISKDIYESSSYSIECTAISFLIATPILFLLHYTVFWSRATLYEEVATAFVDVFNPAPNKSNSSLVQFLSRTWMAIELAFVLFVARWGLVTLVYGPDIAAALDSTPSNFSNATVQEYWDQHWKLRNGLVDSFLGIKGAMMIVIILFFGELAKPLEDTPEDCTENGTQIRQLGVSPRKEIKKAKWPIVVVCGLPYLLICSILWYARRKWSCSLDRLFSFLWFSFWIFILSPFPVLAGWVTEEFIDYFYLTRLFVFTLPAFYIFAVIDSALDCLVIPLQRCWNKTASLPEADDLCSQKLVRTPSIV